MIEIKLKADRPFHNNVDVAVIDFPQGIQGKERRRCKVTVEFAESDVDLLKERGFDQAQTMAYYEDWLYNVVKVNLSQEWKCIAGWEEVMEIIKEHVAAYD